MKTLLERSRKGFICTEESDLIIPMVNGFINQDLYQVCYNWIASYYKLPGRFFPLFRDGAIRLNPELAEQMKTHYKVDCTPPMLLRIFRTYFKDARDLRALALAYTNTLKNIKLTEEERNAFLFFLNETESEIKHIGYIARIKTASALEETLKYVDLSLRVSRSNLIESLLALETAEDTILLGRLINIYEQDFTYMLSRPEQAVKENICVYMWFFEKILRCLQVYKSLEGQDYTKALCRVCKMLTQRVVYMENDFKRVRKLFDWSDDFIRYINLICLTHLRSTYFKYNSHVKLSEYIENTARLFSVYARNQEWLEEAEIVFDLYELGQEEVEHHDLMPTFISHLDTTEPLEYFEEVYRICAKYPTELSQLVECGFLRNAECAPLDAMSEKEQVLTFYNRIKYLGTKDMLQENGGEDLIKILASHEITDTMFLETLSRKIFTPEEFFKLVVENDDIAVNLKDVLQDSKAYVIKDYLLEIFSKASLEFLNEKLHVFRSSSYYYSYVRVDSANITEFINNRWIGQDSDLVKVLAPKIPLIGLMQGYEEFYKVLAVYYKDNKEVLNDAEEVMSKIEEYTGASEFTIEKIAGNIMNPEQYQSFMESRKASAENKTPEELISELEDYLDDAEYFSEVIESLKTALSYVNTEEQQQQLFSVILDQINDLDYFDDFEESLNILQVLAAKYGIEIDDLSYQEEEEDD